jgi:ElaB/YqjD/DUF883 family membrane-anchored ribosome-binding protein
MNDLKLPYTPPQIADMLESELTQFRKELSKDQVSVHDRYEQLKKELREAIAQMKDMLKDNKSLAKDVAETLRFRLALLEEQVHAPKVTEAEILEQLNRIRKATEDVVKYLGSLSIDDLSLAGLTDRIYRYKVKLAILKLRIQLGTLKMKDSFLDIRHDVTVKLRCSEKTVGKRWNVFHHEISEAYEHLQKAFTSK